MKNYIFDREKDDFLRDDGEKIFFPSNDEVYHFLKTQEFKDEWIKENFFIMKGCKILIPEEIETSAPPQPIEQQLKNHAIDFSDFLVRENYVNRSLPHEKSQFYEKMELGKSYPILHVSRIYDEWQSLKQSQSGKENELSKLEKEYRELLDAEYEEAIRYASAHGWKSSRYEMGKELREKIESFKKTNL